MTVIHGSVNTLKITQHALNRCLQWQQTDSPNVGGLLTQLPNKVFIADRLGNARWY